VPNINLTDSRKRDAVVKAESTTVADDIRLVDAKGNSAYTRKILKASIDRDYDALVARHKGDNEKLALQLIDDNPEVDIEKCGLFLWGVSRVYVNSDDGIVYRIEQFDNVRAPDGELRERRPRQRAEPNVDSDIPLTWSGRKVSRREAATRFLFTTKLQIVHINGLTYDFLYGMAKELAESDSMMMLGGGGKGRDPLVFRRGSIPYRGFLEGRVQKDRYILLLHLSNMELKLPDSLQQKDEDSVELDTAKPRRKPHASKEQASKEQALEKKKSTSKSGKTKSTETADSKTPNDDKPSNAKAPEKVDASQNTAVSSDDLGVWLKSIRMGKYLELFIKNEIDVDVLPELTDDDLKELDIPVGSRRRLLAAVAAADNLRAEVSMAVSQMTSKADKASPKKKSSKKKSGKKKSSKSGKTS